MMLNKVFAVALTFSLFSSLLASDFRKINEQKLPFFVEKVQINRTFDESKKMCETAGMRLPSVLEYLQLETSEIDSLEKSLYWSTAFDAEPTKAYYFSTKDRDVNLLEKKENLYVLCVKSSEPKKVEKRYEKIVSGVLDNKTKLVWQVKDKKEKIKRFDFNTAKTYCVSLNGAWRLPTIYELYTLAEAKNESEKEFLSFFDDTFPRYYRTSQTSDDFMNSSVVVGFKIGSIATLSNKEQVFVRCVRDSK